MSIKFSVLIPVYTKENPDYMKTCLESILDNQTVLPAEVVIVEDGPITTGLELVLNQFSTKYQEIIKRYKLSENQGMGMAMNFGLQKVKYEWVARMDSDDIATPNRFECQVEFLSSHPDIDVLGSSTEEFNFTTGDLRHFRKLPQNHHEIIRLMKFRNPINHMTAFFRTDLAIRAGGYWSNRYLEDYNLWYEMKKKGAKFHNLDQNLVHARVGNNMVSRRSGYNYFKYEKILLKKFRDDNFITSFEYLFLNVVKLFFRIMPTSLLRIVYRFFLRDSDKNDK